MTEGTASLLSRADVQNAAKALPTSEFLEQLSAICDERGLVEIAARLEELQVWISGDMAGFEAELAVLERGASVVQRTAYHLLDLDGKHLRPMCVALAAKIGDGFGPRARLLAVAVELIHNATLLHDDVVDLDERRRGAPTARIVYGNAASIFAGDWLLVGALRRIQQARIPGVLDFTLSILDEMIAAEGLQLKNRRRLNTSRADYFRVVEGKTAALFRWALYAGARAGGLSESQSLALEGYGTHLGVAFQLVDDLLDYSGDEAVTGKGLFADLREGRMTYPLLLAVERDPTLRPLIEEILRRPAGKPIPKSLSGRVLAAMVATGGADDCRELARERARAAIECLDGIPPGPGREALVTVAEASVYRQR